MLSSLVTRLRPAGLRARIAIVTVVGLLASVFAIGGVVGYETYFACVNNSSGTIKVVSSNADCNTGDYFIEWNRVGPKGDTGDPGPQGDTGPMGPAGAKGDTGLQGETGPMGLAGAKGDTGPMGLAGAKGDTGDQGPQGEQGLKGDTGDRGPQGFTGMAGPRGFPGPPGPVGPVGPVGIDGYELVVASGTETLGGRQAIAQCPSGKRIFGGGSARSGTVSDHANIVIFRDSPSGNAWIVNAIDSGAAQFNWNISAWAICAFVDN